ncbi:MAG: ATP-binding protein, partial [Gemmobacter sp.]
GLAICRELAGLMGGRIWVEPATGGGACFVVELPLPLDEGALQPPTAGQTSEPPPSPLMSSPRILVAEDHPLNRLVAPI